MRWLVLKMLAGLLLILTACGEEVEPVEEPQGMEEGLQKDALEEGSVALQSQAPLEPYDLYLVGFHVLKENPVRQFEAHHYCDEVNDEFMQCVIFDGNEEDATMNGIEYIISERLFESLPEEERSYWHPHNYEILSGQLAAPGLPDEAKQELLERTMNTYGKSWHFWNTGTLNDTGNNLPFGKAKLAWSLNRDGEAIPGLIEQRDSTMDVNSEELREERKDLINLANPQWGVDALKGEFSDSTISIPGVMNKNEQQ